MRFAAVGLVLIGVAVALHALKFTKLESVAVSSDLLMIGGAGATLLVLANLGPLISSLKWTKDGWELNINGAMNEELQALTAKVGDLEIRVDKCCAEAGPTAVLETAPVKASNRKTTKTAEPEAPPRPGASLEIIDKDDENRGRFGGKAKAGGFRLDAAFKDGGEWVTVTLTVSADPTVTDLKPGEYAEFHLHSTFPTEVMRRPIRDGEASLVITCWGGFTVGVWIPSRKVELELNLAAIKTAPRIIRTR